MNNGNDSTLYLQKIGRLVSSVEELKSGDIVGHANLPYDVRLYCVDHVVLKPTPPYLVPPRPYVSFLPPHVGLSVGKGKVCRHYIHVPMPGESYKYNWSPNWHLSEEEAKDPCLKDIMEDECFPLYLIEDEKHKKLGQLILLLKMPSWGVLAQTTQGEDEIFKFVDAVKGDIQQSWELYNKIKKMVNSMV